MEVVVSAKTISVPRRCACCGAAPDSELEVTASRTTGKRVVRTRTNSWTYPYCSRCLGHVREIESVGAAAVACFLVGAVGGLVVGVALSGGVGLGFAVIAFVVGAIFDGQRKSRIRNQLPSECATAARAVRYLGWNGTVQVFDFVSADYAAAFASANRSKLVNVSSEVYALLEAATPAPQPRRSDAGDSVAGAPTRAAAPSPPRGASQDDLFLKWISKVESLKGPAARRAAVEQGLKELQDPALRERLLLEAAKINVHAALDKADGLKTAQAKRRTLQTALDEVRGDQLADELQAREIQLLTEALGTLETPAADARSS
jgi:hypothetical protein